MWLMASPFRLGFANVEPAWWNSLVVGVLIVFLGLWSHALGNRLRAEGSRL
jgi:hypothetical protein